MLLILIKISDILDLSSTTRTSWIYERNLIIHTFPLEQNDPQESCIDVIGQSANELFGSVDGIGGRSVHLPTSPGESE